MIRFVCTLLFAVPILIPDGLCPMGSASAQSADVQEVDSPPAARQGAQLLDITVIANERFSGAEGKLGLCDVYCPKSAPPPNGFPVVVVVHGGGWVSGDKWAVEGYSRRLAQNGFVAININYRLAPTHKFPTQVDDVRSALLWTRQNATRFSVNINRLGIFGYSAGGHLSALIASLADESIEVRAAASHWKTTDERWNQMPTIRAICAGGPPCDFRTMEMDNLSLSYFLGGSRREVPDVYIVASPAAHVSPGDPVTQLIHGDQDAIVPISESREFHKLQRAAGIDSRLNVMPKQGHLVTFLNPKTVQTMLEFFQEVL